MSQPVQDQSANSASRVQSANPVGADDLRPRRGWASAVVGLFLATLVWAVFGQTRHHEFVNYDDDTYVYRNAAITNGFTLNNAKWSFTHTVGANWHPLTTMSHMLDCQLWGLNPAGHHLTNVLFHALAVILLFLVLLDMTGLFWEAAFVAAVFAIHPLRVESVAWVAERKDVLSGMFFMLTLWAYTQYARQTGIQSFSKRAVIWYALALMLFALGLMSKPMLVTLPFILLLLDYWPLQRTCRWSGLLVEKIPFLLLTVAAIVGTILAQKFAIHYADHFAFRWRLANAVVSCVDYISQMFYPVGLAPFYPHPGGKLAIWKIATAALMLVTISGIAFAMRRRHPYLLVGWLWYLGMLVPVIGLVQVGEQARADRYTYLPQIGLYVLLTWSAVAWCGQRRARRALIACVAIAAVGVLLGLARNQTTYWKNGTTLWNHTLACTSGNYLAHYNLGVILTTQRRTEESIAQYEQALEFKPDYQEAHVNLANALADEGKSAEAISHYEKALQLVPGDASVYNDLGTVLDGLGRTEEAIQDYQRAIQFKPDYANPHFNWGVALAGQGKTDEAVAQYAEAIKLRSDYAEAHYNWANVMMRQRKLAEAASHYEEALRLNPDYTEAHVNLGIVLANQGKLADARNHLQVALKLATMHTNPQLTDGIRGLLQKIDRAQQSQGPR